MNLTDKLGKLKQGGKKAALAGILGSSLLYNSGCTPVAIVAGAALLAQSNERAAETQAQATRDAAKVQTQANQPQVAYIPRQNRFFAAEGYKGDLNRNGAYDFEEYDRVGNEFEPNKPIFFGAEIFNRLEEDLVITDYKIESDGKKLFRSEKIKIHGSHTTFNSFFYEGMPAGIYLHTYEIGNETIGSTLVEVKSNLVNK